MAAYNYFRAVVLLFSLTFSLLYSNYRVIPPERSEKSSHSVAYQQADYVSDKLYDFFVDRKQRNANLITVPINNQPSTSSASNSWNPFIPSQSKLPEDQPKRPELAHNAHVNAPKASLAAPSSAALYSSAEKIEDIRSAVILAPPPDPPKDLKQKSMPKLLSSTSGEQAGHGDRHSHKKRKAKRRHSNSSTESEFSDPQSSSSVSCSPVRTKNASSRADCQNDGSSEPSTSSITSGFEVKTKKSYSKGSGKRSDDSLVSPSLRDLDSPELTRVHHFNDTNSTPSTPSVNKLMHDEKKKDSESPKGKLKQVVIPWEPSSSGADPRKGNLHYCNDEKELFFPTFYTEDEAGHKYCRYLHGIHRRPSHPFPSTPVHTDKSSPVSAHLPASRTVSSGSSEQSVNNNGREFSPTTTPITLEPFTLPDLTTPIDPHADFGLPVGMNHLSDRINAISSKIDNMCHKHTGPNNQRGSAGTLEEDLLKFRHRKSQSMSSGFNTPNSTPSTPQATDCKDNKLSGKLTINIPAQSPNTSASSSPNIPLSSSCSIQMPQTPTELSQRSMSLSGEQPPFINLQPRSMSYSFNSMSPSLPLPPPPPQLMSPQHKLSNSSINEKLNELKNVQRPRTPSPTPKMPTPTLAPAPTPPVLAPAPTPKLKSPVNGKALPSPNTPKFPKEEKAPQPTSSAEEDDNKKKADKVKLLQSLQIPRKKDPNQKENISSFASPLSRTPSSSFSGTPVPHSATPKSKMVDRPKFLSTHPSTSKEHKSEDKEKKEKDKEKEKKAEKKDKRRHSTSGKEVPKTFNTKERQAAFTAELEKIKEKALKKHSSKKEREEYLKNKENKLKEKFERLKLEHEKAKKERNRKLEEKAKAQAEQKKAKEKELKGKQKLIEKKKDKSVDKDKEKDKEKRPKTPSDGDSEDDDSDDNTNRADFGLKSSEFEAQVILYEAAKKGTLNLSMYERIKRKRTASSRPDTQGKSDALAKLREQSEKKKRRVHLSSDSEKSDYDSSSRKPHAVSSDDDSGAETVITTTSMNSKKSSKSSFLPKKFKEMKKEKSKELKELLKPEKKKLKEEPISDDEIEQPKLIKKVKEEKEKEKKHKKQKANSDSDESEGEAAVKNLKRQLDSNNETDSDVSKPKEKERKKKMSKKQSMTNFDDRDIFAANSDDDESGREKVLKKKLSKDRGDPSSSAKVYTGKPGRPKKVRESEEGKEGKSKKTKEEDPSRLAKKRSIDKDNLPSTSEPSKKKHKEDDKKEKKKKRLSDLEVDTSTSKPCKPDLKSPVSTSIHMEVVKHEVSPALFAAISPTSSNHSEHNKLENFVIPTTKETLVSPLLPIQPNVSSEPHPTTSAEEKDTLSVAKSDVSRRRSSSSSSFASSATSVTSLAWSSTSKGQKDDTLPERQQASGPSVQPEEVVEEEPMSIHIEHDYEEKPQRPNLISLSPSRLLEEIHFEESSPSIPDRSNNDEDDDDIEAELLRQIAQQPAKKDDETVCNGYSNQNTQETEDAIESISALMDNNKSEDEYEDMPYESCLTSNQRRMSDVPSEGSRRTSVPEMFEVPLSKQADIEPVTVTVPSVPHIKTDLDPHPNGTSPLNKKEDDLSPMSKVIASVASGDSNILTSTSSSSAETEHAFVPAVIEPVVSEVPTSVNSHVHLPTPPPSRSSEGSPQSNSQFQYTQNVSTVSVPATKPTTAILEPITPLVSTPVVSAPSQQDFKHLENQLRTLAGQMPPSVSLPFTTQPTLVPTATVVPQIKTSTHTSLSSPVTSVPTSSAISFLNQQQMTMAHGLPNQQLSPEFLYTLLQTAGINPSSLSPQQLMNPSMLLPALMANPKVSESIRMLQQHQLAQEAQNKQQQFLQFSNYPIATLMAQRQQTQQQVMDQQIQELLKQREIKTEMPVSIPNLITENQRQYWFNESRYPLCWKGNLAMKSNETRVQMHLICGNYRLMESTAQELAEPEDGIQTIRINQRMRLHNPHLTTVCNKMSNANEFVALICLPCGNSVDQVVAQTNKMSTSFISYFTSKMAAGVVTHTTSHANPSCIAHVFPPCDWAESQLNRLAPDFAKEIDKVQPTYLFVVVTRNENVALKPELNGHVSVPLMPQALNCGKTA